MKLKIKPFALAFELAILALCAYETGFLPWLWGAGEAATLKSDPFATPTLIAGSGGVFDYAPEWATRAAGTLAAFVWARCLAGFAWSRWGVRE